MRSNTFKTFHALRKLTGEFCPAELWEVSWLVVSPEAFFFITKLSGREDLSLGRLPSRPGINPDTPTELSAIFSEKLVAGEAHV